jgi:hypothetical protein
MSQNKEAIIVSASLYKPEQSCKFDKTNRFCNL